MITIETPIQQIGILLLAACLVVGVLDVSWRMGTRFWPAFWSRRR